MENIEIYRNSSIILLKKLPSKIYYWTIILIISFLIFIIISVFYRYDKIISYEAVTANSYIEFYVLEDFFDKNNMELLINDKKYNYQIKNIDPFTYYDSKVQYWKITIDAEIPTNWKIENNKLSLNFKKEKTTYLKEIIKFIKKGMK